MSQLTVKTPSHQYDDQVRASVDDLMDHYFDTRVANELEVGAVSTGTAELSFHKTWKLDTRTQHETRTGRLSGHNYQTLSECKQAVSHTCQQIESGRHSGFTSALESFVARSPTRATWEQVCNLGHHDTVFQYIHSCSTCGGRGRNTCSSCHGQGRTRCVRCSGQGRTSCSSCGGSGQTGTGQHRTFCGGCSGSGRNNCSFCFGSGQAQCNGCGGRGENACSPCDATGYFTERFSIEVKGVSGLRVATPEGLEDWHRSYLSSALNGGVSWASLSAACFLDPASILRKETAYPVEFDIQGTLPFTEARLGLRGLESNAHFVGENCHVYQLGHLGDAVFTPLAQSLTDPEDQDTLKSVLGTLASQQLLNVRNEPARAESGVLRQAGIIGQQAVTTLLQRYQSVREQMNVSRSSHTLKSWLLKSIKYTVLFLLVLGLVDALYGNFIEWEQTGLYMVVLWGQQLPRFVLHMSSEIWLDAPLMVKGVWLALSVVGYLAAWALLLSRRKMTKKRFFFGVVVTYLVLLVLHFIFYRFVDVAITILPGLPGLHELAAGLVRSLILLPEAVVVGMLLGMMRLRLRNDAQLKAFVTAVGSKPLLEDLGYRA